MAKKEYSSSSNSSTTIPKGIVNYPQAFDLQKDDLNKYSVYIMPPFKNFKEYVAVFPSFTNKGLGILPIARQKFSEACSNGSKILNELIKKGILDQVSLTEVRLKENIRLTNEENTRKIVGVNLYKNKDFSRIRRLLQVSRNTSESYKHENFIYYKNRWRKPQDMPHILKEWAGYLAVGFEVDETKLRLETYFKLPYSYFSNTSLQQADFKQNGIQPVKDLLNKNGFPIIDDRGKGPKEVRDIKALRSKIIIKTFKSVKKTKRIPFKRIMEAWEAKLFQLYPNDESKADKYILSNSIIRRVLRGAGLP